MSRRLAVSFPLLALIVSMTFAIPARADGITVTLNPAQQLAVAGQTTTFTFNATVTNNSSSALSLNSLEFGSLDSGLTFDPLTAFDPFNNNFPLSLNAGDHFTGDFFVVTLNANAPAGIYNGTFDLLYGPGTDFVSGQFQVNSTPEPGSIVLLGTGLAGLAGSLRRRLRKS